MNNTKLNELLENVFPIAEMTGNKHMGYFYEKYRSLDEIEQGLPCGVVVWKIVSLARSSAL